MLESFEVRNFRCFEELKVGPFSRINVISGKNNVGKTSLLEALFLYLGAHNPDIPVRLNAFRGLSSFVPEETWGWLFRGRDTLRDITLSGTDPGGVARTLKLTEISPPQVSISTARKGETSILPGEDSVSPGVFNRELQFEFQNGPSQPIRSRARMTGEGIQVERAPVQPFPTSVYLSTRHRPGKDDVDRFSRIQEMKEHANVVSALQIVDPRLRSLAVHSAGNTVSLRADIGEHRLIPLNFLGEGVTRLLSIVLAITSSPNGATLIDEIENGFHYSILDQVWAAVSEAAARSNTQVFATTHSRECIMAAHEFFDTQPDYPLRLFRLESTGLGISAVAYDREQIETSKTLHLEVR